MAYCLLFAVKVLTFLFIFNKIYIVAKKSKISASLFTKQMFAFSKQGFCQTT